MLQGDDAAGEQTRYMGRVAREGSRVATAGALAWLLRGLLAAPQLPESGLVSWSLVLGTFALSMLLCTAAVAPLLALSRRPLLAWELPAFSWRLALHVALVAAAGLLLGLLLTPLLTRWVPASLAYPEHVSGVASAYLGAGLAVLGAALWSHHAGQPVRSRLPWNCLAALLAAFSLAAPHLDEVIGSYGPLYELGFLLLIMVAALPLVRPTSAAVRAWAAALTLLLSMYLFWATAAFPSARAQFFRSYVPAGKLAVRMALLFDMDRDGMPAVLGGSDCDDFDAQRSPSLIEIVGNGIDDNCTGGDLPKALAPPAPVRLAQPPARNLIFVALDAARADLLTAKHMPRLFAQRAKYAVFNRAYANANHTSSSFLSMMTGTFSMGATVGWGNSSAGYEPPVPRLLASVGYHSLLAFQAHFSVDGTWGSERWFTEVDRRLAKLNVGDRGATSELTTRNAIADLERLQAADKPFVACFHYLDMHEEYLPRKGTPFSGASNTQRYFQEAWSVDRDLGKLLDYLESSGYFQRDGVLVLYSDHGEVVEDGGRTGHAYYVDEEVLRVLLLVRGPTVVPGSYDTRVNLVDLYPTVLELSAGIGASGVGRNLKRVWNGTDRRDARVVTVSFYDEQHVSVVIDGPYKLVEDMRLGIRQLYDLSRDPHEKHDLAEAQPAIVERLHEQLGRLWDLSMNDQLLARRRAYRH